jgi:hypothetical protein
MIGIDSMVTQRRRKKTLKMKLRLKRQSYRDIIIKQQKAMS